MIISFGNKDTENIFNKTPVPGIPPEIQEKTFSALSIINAAKTKNFLKLLHSPKGNLINPDKNKPEIFEFEINNSWSIFFRLENGNAYDARLEKQPDRSPQFRTPDPGELLGRYIDRIQPEEFGIFRPFRPDCAILDRFPPEILHKIRYGELRITPMIAIKIAQCLEMDARSWIRLQEQYDNRFHIRKSDPQG